MSKIKGEKPVKDISNKTFPVDKKFKKKLNKRQRKIKKILKDNTKFKLHENLKPEEHKKTNGKENLNFPAAPKPLIDSKKDNVSSDQNSESYSSNWKQLKQKISNSKKRLQDPRKLNRKHEDTQNTLDMKNNNSKINNENIYNNSKSITKKNITDAILDKSDVKSFESPKNIGNEHPNVLRVENSFTGFTKVVAIDCEMVGGGFKGETDILARVSIVNEFGNVLYDKYVKPKEPVVDYRTEFSGIRPENLVDAESFEVVQKEVNQLLSGKLVVGHGVKNDFKCLYLSHPKNMIRDTSKFKPFRSGRRTPSLRKLSENILGIKIQCGEHDSVQDAQAAMRLYSLHKKEWEKEVPKVYKRFHKTKKKKGKC